MRAKKPHTRLQVTVHTTTVENAENTCIQLRKSLHVSTSRYNG